VRAKDEVLWNRRHRLGRRPLRQDVPAGAPPCGDRRAKSSPATRAERDRSLAGLRLRRVHPPPHPRLGDSQIRAIGVGQADLAPAKALHLATPEAGRDEDEEEDTSLLAPSARLAVRLSDELLEGPLDAPDLRRRQDPPASARLPWSVDDRYGIRPHERRPPLRGGDEQLVQEVQVAVDRPRAETLATLASDVAVELSGVDRVKLPRSENGDEVTLDDRAVAFSCRSLQVPQVGIGLEPLPCERRERRRKKKPRFPRGAR
jgi:hypothetical protein